MKTLLENMYYMLWQEGEESERYAGDLAELSVKVNALTSHQQQLLHLANTHTHADTRELVQGRHSSCQ